MQQLNWSSVLLAPTVAAFATGASLALAAPAGALESISLSVPFEESAAEECPRLTQIKYPWIQCSPNAWGGKTLNTPSESDSWSESRRIPPLSEFSDGGGYWGPHSTE